jgi:hypothetical protein
MYFFVRFTGIVTIIIGALLMLLGVGTALYGFIQNEALIDLVNNYWLAGSNSRLMDARFYAALFGLFFFLGGMVTAALGQLLLVFTDIATQTHETNVLLRMMRKTDG